MTENILDDYTEDDFKRDYEEFAKGLIEFDPDSEDDIQVSEWILLVHMGAKDMEHCFRAVHDAYRLGFAAGKGLNDEN